MNKYWWVVIAAGLVSGACGSKQAAYQEVRDRDLTIQYSRMPGETGGTGTLKVRVIPSPAVIGQLGKETRENLVYRMDSCFFTKGKKAVYPAVVQSVATGSGKIFEYLVAFDDLPAGPSGTKVIYRDRYLNKKTYQLILPPQ